MKMNKKGFTIVELMIATVIFGIVLLIATSAILSLSRQYYKGITQSKVQETARNVVDEVANNIKYSTGNYVYLGASDFVYRYCIADRQYTYLLGTQLGDEPSQSRAVLLRGNECLTSIPDKSSFVPSGSEVELVAENMRLSNLVIEPDSTGRLISITARVVYGTDDQLCSPAAGDCSDDNTDSLNYRATDAACKRQSGSQFCGAAEYTAVVTRRL